VDKGLIKSTHSSYFISAETRSQFDVSIQYIVPYHSFLSYRIYMHNIYALSLDRVGLPSLVGESLGQNFPCVSRPERPRNGQKADKHMQNVQALSLDVVIQRTKKTRRIYGHVLQKFLRRTAWDNSVQAFQVVQDLLRFPGA
jgi:hypothetical protein